MAAPSALARRQHDLVTRRQAMAAGMTGGAVDARVARGTWLRVLPGVLLTRPRALGDDDLARAALLFAGPEGMLTAHTAARRHGVRHVAAVGYVAVLLPAGTTVRSRGFVRIIETTRPPEYAAVVQGLRVAPAARAVADSARLMSALRSVRAMVADSVQRGICAVSDLLQELTEGPRRGSALLRAVLDEVAAGARSAPEAQLLKALRTSGLPAPECNVPLLMGGRVVAVPDFCWRRIRLIVEVDSREWHLSPQDWERTMRRHNRLQAMGYVLLHFPPSRIRHDLAGVLAEIKGVYARLDAAARA